MITPQISVCMIAKNEEKHIEECLKRLKPYHYEIVLVDTGSTDSTLEIAARYTDKIYHFDWVNDFSAARNFALDKASNNWVLSIDCDEYIESIDEKELSILMEKHSQDVGQILIRNRFKQGAQTSIENVRVSRFFNKKYYHFVGAIHEQVELRNAEPEILTNIPTITQNNSDCQPHLHYAKHAYYAPITLLHVGYDGSEEEMRTKCLRNISMLEKELEAVGPDSYIYYQLGQSCMKLEDYHKAYEWFNLGLSMDVDPAQSYVQTMVESYGYCMLELKKNEEALQLLNIYDVFSVRADFVFLMGLIYMNNGRFDKAVEEFINSTTIEQYSVEGTNSYRANYNIGVIYECTGHLDEARKYYKKCGEFEMAKVRLRALE
ncbi:MAG: glycosyltransferase [Lachnospiraceae bacterium]|nr:glycosyltransferase [Lachnospiraceae bacterium]